ncbi:DUF1566 domain-containing protein [Neptunomonas marina]|uniref:DUF1566 domain-containing protein n=1 Tax=Neptunomonas marina TaxID=1815562 RepID=A0A437QEB3_9GAMM|nr:DUF1566 domain-containing protein [Neptunomonas marina]RVU32733.1 DUF1566 domain-containing protein [Neptunomonas marina]
MKKGLLALGAAVALSSVAPANAALAPASPGLINDTTLNITWLQDANLVKTSCDANNALWQAFDPSTSTGNTRSKAQICADNGRLNWYEAEDWVAVLNSQSYLGYNDWRQPETTQPDASCSLVDGSSQNYGYRCTGSELGHLFNVSLGNPNEVDNSCFGVYPHCLQNTGPFSNMQSFTYWSGTEYAPLPTFAFYFGTDNGYQDEDVKDVSNLFVWPVRGGQSAVAPTTAQAIPALGGFGLVALGALLAGLAGWRIRLFG